MTDELGIKGQVMQCVGAWFLGTAGFLLYFIYDVNSVIWKKRELRHLFAVGSLCVAGSAVWAVAEAGVCMREHTAIKSVFGAGAVLFFVLLIYTLFFALPFEETYLDENRMRPAYTEGVYSLCRHPGVLWFAGIYLCLWGLTAKLSQGSYFLSMIIWNVFYIVFQDLWTFPRSFTNYEDYKKETPFLLPNGKSIKGCWRYRKKGNRS